LGKNWTGDKKILERLQFLARPYIRTLYNLSTADFWPNFGVTIANYGHNLSKNPELKAWASEKGGMIFF